MAPTLANPRGYFESSRISDFDDEALSRLGSSWDDPVPIPEHRDHDLTTAALTVALEALLRAELPRSPLVVVKDPRICILAPLWIDVLRRNQERVACVLVGRNPLEVAKSLNRRNGIPTLQGLALWLRYTLEAELHTRGRTRTFVLFDDLLQDWRGVCDRIGADLGVVWPEPISESQMEPDAFLSETLRNFRVAEGQPDRSGRLELLSHTAWHAIRRLAEDPADSHALASLDQARSLYFDAAAIFGPLMTEGRDALRRIREAVDARTAEARTAMSLSNADGATSRPGLELRVAGRRTWGEPRPAAVSAAPFPLPNYVLAASELCGRTGEVLDVTVSVIIPTYNAGSEFVWLLRKLKQQKGLKAVEIVVVDSGSTDQTVDMAEQIGCVLVRRDKRDFSHSLNRNIGADHATGELLLFTVQDAYPVGDYWLHALARALLHPRSEDERLAAVSCSERPRSDTELFYNEQIEHASRLLNCSNGDRIGRFISADSPALRVQAQLSNIACMTPKAIFMQYRYTGQFAEDLLFGLRLIRDGLRVGMLSSVQVIHSHKRPANYHLRRAFVNHLFLTEVFPDSVLPPDVGLLGAINAASTLQALIRDWRPAQFSDAVDAIDALTSQVAAYRPSTPVRPGSDGGFGLAPLSQWLMDYAQAEARPTGAMSRANTAGAEQLRSNFWGRLHATRDFVDRVLAGMDARIAAELTSLAEKSLAMGFASQLAFSYLHAEARGDRELTKLRDMLLDGV